MRKLKFEYSLINYSQELLLHLSIHPWRHNLTVMSTVRARAEDVGLEVRLYNCSLGFTMDTHVTFDRHVNKFLASHRC